MMLAEKTVLVTGAKGGLGSVVTRLLLGEGARVVGSSRSIRDSDFAHPQFLAIAAELHSAAAAEALVENAVARAGALDAVVHLVGGFEAGSGEEVLARMMEVNLHSAWRLFHAALPVLRGRGSGRLVAVASRTAVEPAAGLAAYTASKAALVSLVRTLAVENAAHGITANAVLPGTIDTAVNREAGVSGPGAKGAWVGPEQVAQLIAHLVSGPGGAISGAVLPIYGEAQ